MSKKKKIIAVTAILLAIFVSFLGGKTFSKYVTEVNGVGNAEIASWNFKVNENEEEIQTIKLASTIDNETLVNNKIAPGVNGSFTITVDGTGSDVGINYTLNVENETQKPQNLIYKYNGKTYNNLSDIAKDASGIINANDDNKVKEIKIDWSWNYETGSTEKEKIANNKQDTIDAKTITDYSFDIIVTGIQVIPNA